ncbi:MULTISPECIES: hypothetical protein [unclassified Nitrospina]|uniref:hypothetical protein n=1 Tax=unclassified Nitrospina TaxID=2638683 RepID=UPI003F96AD2D
MRTFPPTFDTAKNQTAQQSVHLLKIDWSAVNGYPPLTVRLADRSMSTGQETWLALVADWGELDNRRTGGPTPESHPDVHLTLINAPAVFAEKAERFSDLFEIYPPEAATVTLYHWFEEAGLDENDLVPLLTGRLVDPIEYDPAFCRLRLVNLHEYFGRIHFGRAINLTDYPQAPEKNLGRMCPIVFGRVDRAPGVLVRKTRTTRMTSVATPGATTLDVADTTGFTESGTLVVNDDLIGYTGTTPTAFTGCSGVNDYHYAGDEVLEWVTDHRYLFSDPAYPIKDIRNVQVAGVPADPASYSIDVSKGEVVFTEKPCRTQSIDTRFLQAQFDTVAGGNTAVDAIKAMDPGGKTQYARINQFQPLLKLQQTDAMPSIGEINKVFLRVEHFVEEKLPNDSVVARFEGLGQVGVLSPPSADEGALTSGSTDITHTHLDTLGFPVNNPDHLHGATSEADHIIVQGASSGPGGDHKVTGPADVGPFSIPITFPAPPAGGVLSAEFRVNWRFKTITFTGTNPVATFVDGADVRTVGTFNPSRGDFDYTQTFTVSGGAGGDTWNFKLNNGSMWFEILSVERTLFYPPNPATQGNSLDTVKGGTVTQHGSSPVVAAVTDKTTQTVINFFDITGLVDRDWSWFTNRVVEIEYTGTQDGRTAFIIHAAFEIEFARRRLVTTDAVSAEVDGVKDDATGTITGTPNAVLERPDHLFRWSLLNPASLDALDLDDASFNSGGTALAAAVSGGYQLAGIVDKKKPLRDLWRQWMRESRCVLSWDAEGRVRLKFRPLNEFDAVVGLHVKTLSDNDVVRDPKTGLPRMRFQRTPFDDIANHIELRYHRDWVEGVRRGWTSVSNAASISLYGQQEHPGEFDFDWTQAAEQADDLARFYLGESTGPNTLVEIEVFPNHLELEPGDIVEFQSDLGSAWMLGQVLPGSQRLASGREGRLHTLLITLRLFPAESTRSDFNDTAFAGETWSSLAQYAPSFTETLAVADGAFTNDADGWGVQSWGDTGWGGKVAL